MPSRKKRRLPEGEQLADFKGTATSAAGQATGIVAVDDAGAACDAPVASTSSPPSTSSHDLHANLPLFVTGPAIVHATLGAAWCHGWRLQSAKQGEDDDASKQRRRPDPDLLLLAVPAGAVARLEAAPLGPGDVPLTARSCRVSVTVPDKDQNVEEGEEAPSPLPVSRALPLQNGAGAATATLPPPPPASWRAAAASIAAGARESVAAGGGPPSVVVVGPKNAGKSSFARLLTNELLSAFSSAAAAAAVSAAATDSTTGGAPAHQAFPSVVAWCDVDCGQPELTPPGIVSLSHVSRPLLAGGGPSGDCAPAARAGGGETGPSSSSSVRQQLRPARAHFLGALSPASDPARACAAAASLLRWHWQHGCCRGSGGRTTRGKRETAQKVFWPPLVVNSPGWVRGAGLDLLRAALLAARATHVVRISTGSSERDAPQVAELFEGGAGAGGTLPPFLEVVELPALSSSSFGSYDEDGGEREDAAAPPSSSSLFQGIIPPPPASARYSAADARAASWLSFARSCVASAAADEEEGGGRETPSSSPFSDLLPLPAALAAARPLVLPLSSVRLEFLGERPLIFSNALRQLNGSVVALAAAAEAGKGTDEKEESARAAAPPPPSQIVSLALVRGVDGRRGLLHLLCPLRSSEAAAAGIVALQVGHPSLELPPSLLAGGVVAAASVVSASNSNSYNRDIEKPQIAVSASPYLAPWCLAAGGTGARAAKARNDLARGSGGARS